MKPEYEAATARELGRFMEKGSVIRGKKPSTGAVTAVPLLLKQKLNTKIILLLQSTCAFP